MPMNLSLGLGLGGIPVSEGVGGFSLDAYLASLSDGLYFDATKTDRFFQESTGPTLADDVGEAIGLALDDHSWGPRSLASQLAQATELVSNPGGPFTATTGWTANGATLSVDSGNLRITSTGAGFIGQASATMTTVVGKTYAVRFTSLGGTGGIGTLRIGTSAGGTQIGTFAPGTGTWTYYFVATATTTYLTLCASSTNGQYVDYSICSGKLLDGNHALQATGTLKPTRQTSGAKFDGSDDYLSTLVQPGSGPNFSVALLTVPASLGGFQYAFGSTDGTNRFGYGFNPDGTVGFGFGTTSPIAAKGTTDTRGTEVVVGMSSDGVDALGFVGAEQEYAAALAGSMNNGRAFYLGAVNGGGPASSFFGGSIKKLVAGRDHLSLSRYQQIRTALLSA